MKSLLISAAMLGMLFQLSAIGVVLAASGDPAKISVEKVELGDRLNRGDVRCLLRDSFGFLWIGTSRGLIRFDSRATVAFVYDPAEPNSLAGNDIECLAEDHDHFLWIGSRGGGLNRYDLARGRMERVNSNRPSKHASISSISMLKNGQLWCATDEGSYILNASDGSLTEPSFPPDIAAKNIGRFVSLPIEDVLGNPWMAYSTGVARFDPNFHAVQLFPLNGLHVRNIFATMAGGVLALADNNMIFTFDDNQKQFIPINVHLRDFITTVFEDRLGNLWIGTTSGLLEVVRGATGPPAEVLANRNISAITKDKSGILWVCSSPNSIEKVIVPDLVSNARYDPPIAITGFMLFDNTNKDFVHGGEHCDSVEISYKDIFFAFSFTSLDFLHPGERQFSILLDGYESKWTDIGRNQYARYTNIPSGSYLFRVRSRDNNGVWEESDSPVRITITPPFWKTEWFAGIAIISAGGLIVLMNRYRVQRQIRRVQELERIRSAENRRVRQRAASDFHDEFGHSLTRISLLSQIVKRDMKNGSHENGETLDRIIQTAEELSVGMRDFLWTLNPEKDSAGDIAIRLKDFGDSLFNGTGIAFRMKEFDSEIEHLALAVDWRRHLLLIFKEAMNNAAKHSSAKNVTLGLWYSIPRLTVRLTDDGSGFDPAQSSQGQGVSGMRQRAEKIFGTLSITSRNSEGTVVEFSGNVPEPTWREITDGTR